MTDSPSPETDARRLQDEETARLAKSSDESDRQTALQRIWTESHHDEIQYVIAWRLGFIRKKDGNAKKLTDHQLDNEDFSDLWLHVVDSIYSTDRISRAVESFDPDKGSLHKWLKARAHMVMQKWLQNRRKHGTPSHVTSAELDPAAAVDGVEERCDRFEKALNSLNENQRSCQVLRIVPFRDLTTVDRVAIRVEAENNGLMEPESDRRVDELVIRNCWDREDTKRYSRLLAKLDKVSVKLTAARNDCVYWRQKLESYGLLKADIDELQRLAERVTLDDIEALYKDSDIYLFKNYVPRVRNPLLYAKKRFQLSSREQAQRQATLFNTQQELQKFGGDYGGIAISGTLDARPSEPIEIIQNPVRLEEIAECLNKTKSAVQAALNIAKSKLKAAGFSKPDHSQSQV